MSEEEKIDADAISGEEMENIAKLAEPEKEEVITVDPKEDSFSVEHEIVKAFPQRKVDRRGREYRLIKSMVMSPRKIDKQNDWTDEDEIQDACHEFMINLQAVDKSEDESGISYRHSRLIKSEDARIVEWSQIDFPETWGNKTFPAGTIKIGFRVYAKSLFREIDAGLLRGCSVEGNAIHSPEPLS